MPAWVQTTLSGIVVGVVVSGGVTLGNVVAGDRVQDRRLDDVQLLAKTLEKEVGALKTDSAVAIEILRRIEDQIKENHSGSKR
jgi:hypothetical protein